MLPLFVAVDFGGLLTGGLVGNEGRAPSDVNQTGPDWPDCRSTPRKRGVAAKCDSPGYGHGSSFGGEWTWRLARQLQSMQHRRPVPAGDPAVVPMFSVCCSPSVS